MMWISCENFFFPIFFFCSKFIFKVIQHSSVQSLSHFWPFATPLDWSTQTSLSITNSQSLPKLTSTESVMPPNHLILRHPFLPPLRSFFLFYFSPSIRTIICIWKYNVNFKRFSTVGFVIFFFFNSWEADKWRK